MELTVENLDEVNRKLQNIATSLKAIEACGEKLFLNVADIAELTGWSKDIVRQFMRRPDFPLIKVGKELQVNKLAFVEYTMQRIA